MHKETKKMIILGIDPGYAIVGVGVIEYKGNKFKVLDYGAVTTDAKTPMQFRLQKIYMQISDYIDKYHPDAAAIEELFFNSNQKTAIHVAQARGAIITAIVNKGISLYEYTPLQIKQAVTGYGRADKKQIQQMVKMLLGLNAVPKPDDVADGLAAAICHAHSGVMNNMLNVNKMQ